MLPPQEINDEIKKAIAEIIKENKRRLDAINVPFNPVTGFGSVGERVKVVINGFPIRVQWLPVKMMSVPLVKKLVEAGNLDRFITDTITEDYTDEDRLKVIDAFVRIRSRHDFPFWAATFVTIQSKEPGEGEIPFRLTRPQRRFVAKLEEMRLAGRPIRLVLLKARQWGGSTTSQIYMCWLQLVHKVSLNSVIVAQTKKTSFAIKAMYDRALKYYPLAMMYPQGTSFSDKEPKMVNVGQTGDYKQIPQRDCTITIASYEAPDALRGDAYSLVHCSEVGLWSPTEKKSPEAVVRSACSGVLLRPYTMIIYESTANGTGNFFQEEYDNAKAGKSQFDALFISWFDIDLYSAPIPNDEIWTFAEWLYTNRLSSNVASKREEPGKYLWWLWNQGATLQGIKWYIGERAGKNSHEVMAAEFPTDDVEAFVHSGAKVFDKYRVEAMKKTCKPPKHIGDVYADRDTGKEAFRNVRFSEDAQGELWVWALPEIDPDEIVTNRYLVVVDIGGRSHKADWSVIAVFDRLFMQEGGKPVVVAQWYGHIDIDLLAWKAGQIAAFYDNALLVIESNTLETHDKERQVDGDQSQFVLNQLGGVYDNLYARSSPEDSIVEGMPVKYGFHTNINTKPMVITTLVKVVREASYVERDERCLDEFLTYEKRQNGSFGAVKGKHDDLLMTRAIGLHICFFEMEMPKILPRKKKISNHRRPVSAASI
ncbi:terminase [Muribaculum intestinale]|uniref:terminase n=1 Tax=Muribaculum intestinale TaxID=1796646 RepID=UPI002495858B|nr:terminase [Muribaculum intestinale]